MLQDLRYAFRLLAKSPVFTAVAAISLALGIGANSAIFSLVDVAILKPIPVEEPSTLASVFMTDERNPGNLPLSHLNYKDLRDQNQVFSAMAAFTFAQVNWSNGNDSEQIPTQLVSGNYFSLLGAQPFLGRGSCRMRIAVRRRLPSSATASGSGVSAPIRDRREDADLNRTPFTVVGIAPQGSRGLSSAGDHPCGHRCRCTTSSSRTSIGTSSDAACFCLRSAG